MYRPTLFLCLIVLIVGCSSARISPAAAESPDATGHLEIAPTNLTLEEHVLSKLKQNHLQYKEYRSQLQALLSDPKKPYEKIIALNLLGFMGKADYSVHYSDRAIRKAKEFLKKNGRSLHRAERRFGVSRESIAALLWVETQYGTITGKFPLVQVFLSLLMADHPDFVKSLIKEAVDRRTIEEDLRKRYPDALAFEQKIVDRSHLKADWALDQLKNLEALRKSGYSQVFKLKGSFAGAFGISQFIPSTYRELAISANKNRRPNLYKMPDVILSVANFLKKKGWNEKKPETKSAALYEYNRIKDYGDVILKIAEAIREPKPRSSASAE